MYYHTPPLLLNQLSNNKEGISFGSFLEYESPFSLEPTSN